MLGMGRCRTSNCALGLRLSSTVDLIRGSSSGERLVFTVLTKKTSKSELSQVMVNVSPHEPTPPATAQLPKHWTRRQHTLPGNIREAAPCVDEGTNRRCQAASFCCDTG